jgi:hypothetical protein
MLGASKAGLLGAASTADISFEYLLSDGGAAGGAGPVVVVVVAKSKRVQQLAPEVLLTRL